MAIETDLLITQTERYQHFIESVRDYVKTDMDIAPILQEEQRGLEAILHLPVFDERYPFPDSARYETILGYIHENLDAYPFIWYVLILWNDLRLIGRVITADPQFAEISRSWIDEWGIARLCQETLENLGLDWEQSKSGVNILKMLVRQQNWVEGIEEETPLSLMELWLSVEEIRNFIRINRYRGKLWFNKEAIETLMWWMMTIGLVRLVADPQTNLSTVIESLFDAYGLIDAVLAAKDDSDYQVEKLLEGLK